MSATAAPELSRNASVQARSVIRSDGLARRALLNQLPGFRRGQDAAPAVDTVARDAVRALQICDNERNSNWRSNGSRAITA